MLGQLGPTWRKSRTHKLQFASHVNTAWVRYRKLLYFLVLVYAVGRLFFYENLTTNAKTYVT